MAIKYPSCFRQQFTDANGKPIASGTLEFYRAGTSIPLPAYTIDGVSLGDTVTLDIMGSTEFALDDAETYDICLYDKYDHLIDTYNKVTASGEGGGGSGMINPMTSPGDVIIGGAHGEPRRLNIGVSGQVLTVSSGAPAWKTIPVQTGDHKVLFTFSDATPGYIGDKLTCTAPIKFTRTGIGVNEIGHIGLDASTASNGDVLTADGNGGSAFAAPAVQPGDHKALVTALDAEAGYLADKITAGSNVTITTLTDGSGVQSLQISAAGGGGGGSVITADGVQGDGTAEDPVTLKLDASGNVTLTQGVDGLKADYSPNDEAAEYYSYPFTMSTHLLSRPLEMIIVPIHIDWAANIRSVKYYNGTLGGATTPYMVVLYHSIGDINTPGSYLEPFGYYYKSDSASDIVKGWNVKQLTFRGSNDTWDETEYLTTNGEEIFVGFWSRDSVGVPYIEGYADKAMGCEYTAWGSLPTLSTVKTDIQVASVYALASHIHMILTSEEAP